MSSKVGVLNKDVELRFHELHDVSIKAGTPVRWIDGKGGQGGWVVDPHRVEPSATQDRGPKSLWAHDTTYYYIWVKEADVNEGAAS